jgi:hypothetical protein
MKGGIKQDEYEAKHNDGEAWDLEINESGSYEGEYHDHPDEEPPEENPPPLSSERILISLLKKDPCSLRG